MDKSHFDNSTDLNVSILFQPYKWEMNDNEESQPLYIYAYGRTLDDKTVCARIMNFEPHLYVEFPKELKHTMQKLFVTQFKSDLRRHQKDSSINIEQMKIVKKYKVYYYKESTFLYIPCINIEGLNYIRRFFSKKIKVSTHFYKFVVHEYKISPELKFFAKIIQNHNLTNISSQYKKFQKAG